MPTYTYSCSVHGEFEKTHSIHDKLEICPKCQEENSPDPQPVTRLISGGTGFILSGGGWGSTGYS